MKKMLYGIALIVMGVAAGLGWWWSYPPPPIPVGIVAWLASGAVVGSSEMHAADLYLEEHPQSRLRVLPIDDEWKPERTVAVIRQAMEQGIHFFITTHPSRCAVASLHLFADGRALIINAASASPALTGKDDFLLRIIPDAIQEQRAIARYIDGLPGNGLPGDGLRGRRLLVLQDTSNLPYTDPAFATLTAELTALGRWQIVHRQLAIAEFRPDDYRTLMAEPFDALYILAGSFQTAIGHLAQLFHYLHPQAPILLTPWARSPAILEAAGEAIDRLILASPYGSRHATPVLDDYFRRFDDRFGYTPHVMTIGIRQALELLDQAFAQGHVTPEAVKRYLLSVPTHQTSLGPVAFDRYGDVTGDYHFIHDLKQELQ